MSDEEDSYADEASSRDPSSSSCKVFRNYTPQTKFLDGLFTVKKVEPDSITPFIQDKLDLIKSRHDNSDDKSDNKYRIDPEMLEPKKVDWDLKQRIEKRMEKLERETRKSIDKIRSQKNKNKTLHLDTNP